ncbi:type II toxin-antitoxin system HicA family toxin [Senimuribacter intestinalis]|uniref:type II toxin-antitoxin system HicA family toxin n=1 Tax=Senimuribacter intestinalis TaxID=2941507 RepID=UPI00203B88B6|nr:type II toxin-antitoxin system HicA family toxin [Senimuribacter intestinalis]
MKKRDLEKKLKKAGWRFLRNGGEHDIWTDGKNVEAVPRHREINETTAKGIIRKWGL